MLAPLPLSARLSDETPEIAPESQIQALSPANPFTPLQAAKYFFEFQREPITPRAVSDLLPWLSDTEPGPIALDIEGSTAETNRYWADISTIDAGPWQGAILATWQPRIDQDITYSSAYQWLGRLDNGLHVLRVWQNTGGRGYFTHVLVVRFSTDYEYDHRDRKRLVMTRVGQAVLGDRDDRVITLEGNTIVIPPAEHESVPTRLDFSDYGAVDCVGSVGSRWIR
ncbi:MAG: hypothetical protein ACFB0C_12875 [Leptolyngbyaceae cyanobacterium]